MDRVINYPAQEVLVEDILWTNRFAQVATGMLASLVCGAGPIADGFAVSPNPTGLGVIVNGGSILYQGVVDATAYSVLPADPSPVVRVASSLAPTTLPISGAGTWTVYGVVSEVDDTNTVLPFYDAVNPAIPFSGPGGTGGALPTRRRNTVVLAIAASVPTGATPLWTVTVPAGATSVVNADIAPAPGAPFVTKLPFLAPLFSPHFQGVPTAPTPAVNTNTTQLATAAFVLGQASSAAPLMDGTATVGTSFLYAREGHVHPSDSTKQGTGDYATTPWVNQNFATMAWTTEYFATISWVNNNFVANPVSWSGQHNVSVGWSGSYLQAQVDADFLGQVWTSNGGYPTVNGTLSAGNPGYMVFPNGFIIQWGTSVSWGGENNVTFPFVFPNSCTGLVICEGAGGWSTYGGGTSPTIHAVGGATASGFTHIGCRWNGGSWSAEPLTGNWIATGY